MIKRLEKYSRGGGTGGFTLIELLIVVVIIGILAGVLITIIDPQTAQNRARDAGIQATLNKIALATEAYGSAYGTYPDDASFIGSLSSGTVVGVGAACTGNDDNCTFNVPQNALGVSCDGAAPAWSGNGSVQCYYYYERYGSGASFNLYAKSAGDNTQIFKYSSQCGQIYLRLGTDPQQGVSEC